MTFGKAVSTCFHKYCDLDGRASRSEFWWWFLFATLINGAGEMLASVLEFKWISYIVAIVLFLPSLGVAVRRAQDSNHNGLWIWCPIYNIILMLLPGSIGLNEHGAAPKS